ncbi:MAG: GxxExxY protein [Candidatus Parcubacteria bacterium]|nr:GxxExxY protein [Candidatus Parcubacteria bacterium]
MGEYLYEDLTEKIIGISYKVYNEIGFGYREIIYKRGYIEEFNDQGINFIAEFPVRIYYKDRLIGKYYLDFIIDDKVVVELKIANDFYTKDIKQLLSYLKANKYRLGLLIIFNKDGVKIKRIIN